MFQVGRKDANLAALTEIAAASGAVVRLIGDPKQLAAVETGGLFADLTRTPGTVELSEVMRMGADTEQAEATLALLGATVNPHASAQDRTPSHGTVAKDTATVQAEGAHREE